MKKSEPESKACAYLFCNGNAMYFDEGGDQIVSLQKNVCVASMSSHSGTRMPPFIGRHGNGASLNGLGKFRRKRSRGFCGVFARNLGLSPTRRR